jgi:hypothetical protein
MGGLVKIIFFIGLSFHFALAIKESTLIDGENRCEEISVKLPCGMDLHPVLGTNLSFYMAIDNDCMGLNFSFDDRCFADD